MNVKSKTKRGEHHVVARMRSMSSAVETVDPGKRWRIRGSGVTFLPSSAPLTGEIIARLSEIGVQVSETSSGSPGNADSYGVRAQFLDGGISGQTGNYMGGSRGVWIEGPRSLLVIATLLERTIPEGLLSELRGADPDIDGYIQQLRFVYPSLLKSEIHDDLLKAYLETRYEVFGSTASPLTLQIGESNARLKDAYKKHGVHSAIFITSYNPPGETLPDAENRVRHEDLMEFLRFGRYRHWQGRGYHPSGDWEEKSALALGVSCHSARWLGNKFGQNAIVWVGADAVPRLMLLR
jgi:hypothetical protein